MISEVQQASGDENMNSSNNENTRKEQLQRVVNHIFNDDLMMALAAILASTVFLESAFDLSEGMQTVFQYLNYFIIASFVAEYILKLYVDKQRISFVSKPIHIFDLIIIFLALYDFTGSGHIPFLPDQTQLSPILRLLRILPSLLPRVLLTFLLAGRTAKRWKPKDPITLPSSLKISTLNLKDTPSDRTKIDDSPIWIDFQNVKTDDLNKINKITKIDQQIMKSKLLEAAFPRIKKEGDYLSLFLWDSHIKSEDSNSESFKFISNNMLIFFNEARIITLCRGDSCLFDKILRRIGNEDSIASFNKKNFTDKILHLVLLQKWDDYSKIIQLIDQKTKEFEEIQVDKTSARFLEETFHFKKEILKISGNLLHFQKILDELNKIDTIRSFGVDNSKEFIDLSEDSKYLYETTQNIKENLISLIDLHTNTVDYEMNQIMKVIAVITCLAIIPATVGGLLGVNLQDGVFHIKFVEIFFVIISSMILGIYAFYKMEWLK